MSDKRKLWGAIVEAVGKRNGVKRRYVVIAKEIHGSGRNGRADVDRMIADTIPKSRYDRVKIIEYFFFPESEIRDVLGIGRDDDGGGGDEPAPTPAPDEDDGVKTPALFADLMEQLDRARDWR
jgi:hypothetical protein